MRLHRNLALFLVLSVTAANASAETVVFLVRHGEKVDESSDAALSERGVARANALAAMLKDAALDAVYSTDTSRTRDTARPTAELFSRRVETYEAAALEALAKKLREGSGRSLVVGHSNTTPELARLLGGDDGGPIADDEYDRLYVLVLTPNGKTSTTILRFRP